MSKLMGKKIFTILHLYLNLCRVHLILYSRHNKQTTFSGREILAGFGLTSYNRSQIIIILSIAMLNFHYTITFIFITKPFVQTILKNQSNFTVLSMEISITNIVIFIKK